jgi:hypothetical protein
LKQKKVLEHLAENSGSMRKAILAAGYSQEVADNPQRITESKTWRELTEVFLPDSVLTENHRQLLEQKRIDYFVFPKAMEDQEILDHVQAAGLTVVVIRLSDKGKLAFYSLPDAQAKKAALELAYKIKGKMTEEPPDHKTGNTYNFIFSNPVQEKIKVIDAEIKNMLTQNDDEDNKQD